jgi:putative hydrolase of the HAD superfamily
MTNCGMFVRFHIFLRQHQEILKAWNAVLLDFPLYRLEFLQMLSTKYRLFLLSNTDAIHIAKFESTTGISFTVILPLL